MSHRHEDDAEVEVLIGFVTTILGLILLIWAAIDPVAGHVGSPSVLRFVLGDRVSWLPSVAESGFSLFTVVFLAVMLLSIVGVAVGAYWHGVRRAGVGLALLWISAALLLVGVVASDLTIAMFLFIPTLMAFAVALLGSFNEIQSRLAHNSGSKRG